MWKHGGRGLLRPVRADQSEQTWVVFILEGRLKKQELKTGAKLRFNVKATFTFCFKNGLIPSRNKTCCCWCLVSTKLQVILLTHSFKTRCDNTAFQPSYSLTFHSTTMSINLQLQQLSLSVFKAFSTSYLEPVCTDLVLVTVNAVFHRKGAGLKSAQVSRVHPHQAGETVSLWTCWLTCWNRKILLQTVDTQLERRCCLNAE